MQDYIHFYGSDRPSLFAIERKAMDHDGHVIRRLDQLLPQGKVLDIGAGNGFTAAKLATNRHMTCVEPSDTMPDFAQPVHWVRATAETLPFHDNVFDAAYSTWAYFLPGVDITKGLAEAERVVRPGGSIHIVDNAGDDEFSSFTDKPYISDQALYKTLGFESEIIETSFHFDTLEEAQDLMEAFFGKDAMKGKHKLTYQYRVVMYTKTIAAN